MILTTILLCTTASAQVLGCRDHGEIATALGSLQLPITPTQIAAIEGDHAYLGDPEAGRILVVDLSDPELPALVGEITIPGPASDLAAGPGRLLATVPGTGLLRWDLTDPAAPDLVDTVDLGTQVEAVILVGDLAYVAEGTAGVQAVSLAYPGLTIPLGRAATGSGAIDVAFYQDNLYVADLTEGLVVIHAADPGQLQFAGSTDFPSRPHRIAVDHGLAVIGGLPLAGSLVNLAVYSIADPWQPVLRHTRNITSVPQAPPDPTVLAPDRIMVAIAGQSQGVFDLRLVGPELLEFGQDEGYHRRFVVASDLTMTISGGSWLSLATPGDLAPKPLGYATSSCTDMVLVGDVIHAAIDRVYQFDSIDMSDPVAPVVAPVATPVPGASDTGLLAATEDALYLSRTGLPSLLIFDRVDPLAPALHAELDLGGVPSLITRVDDRLYVALGFDGLAIVDLADPLAPTIVGVCPSTDSPPDYRWGSVAVVGDQVLVCSPALRLDVFDASDPTAPVRRETVPLPGYGTVATAVGSRVLVGVYDEPIQVVGRGADGVWRVVGTEPIEHAQTIEVVGDVVYVLDLNRNVSVLRRTDDDQLELIRVITEGNGRNAMVATEDWIAVSNIALAVLPAQCAGTVTSSPGQSPPRATMLALPAPNPFNPRVELSFRLPRATVARLVVHDLKGRRVRELWRGPAPAGATSVTWDGTDDRGRTLPSGQYLARLVADDRREVQKLTLVR